MAPPLSANPCAIVVHNPPPTKTVKSLRYRNSVCRAVIPAKCSQNVFWARQISNIVVVVAHFAGRFEILKRAKDVFLKCR